jgi:hypothetical protein
VFQGTDLRKANAGKGKMAEKATGSEEEINAEKEIGPSKETNAEKKVAPIKETKVDDRTGPGMRTKYNQNQRAPQVVHTTGASDAFAAHGF